MPAALAPPPAPADAPIALSPHDFDRIRRLILERAGISLHDGKHAMVHGRLTRRMRVTGHRSFDAYLSALERSADAPEWQSFVNSLTTNLTAFFREEHHFTALADELRARGRRPTRIWCNAASTGEEPYSIGMVVDEVLGADPPVTILCSDIDTEVLAKAQRGVYDADARGLSPERLRRHFQRGTGANAGRIRVQPALARRIEFRPFNLTGRDWHALGAPIDIVFCRNVMIYFDAATQRQVLARIHAAMAPDGLLFVGHSENFTDARELFRLRGKTIYERR